jgi:hypothetical protein
MVLPTLHPPAGRPTFGSVHTDKESKLVAAMALALGGATVLLSTLGSTVLAGTAAQASAPPLRVAWMKGFAAPGTPAKYNTVGVIKIGPTSAKNVLVLEPGGKVVAQK